MRTYLLRTTGIAAVLGLALTAWLGLVVTPPDAFQADYVRLLYIHPPLAWVAYLAFGIAALCSILYLWPRTRSLAVDRMALCCVEVGVVFALLTLVTGSIWGRPTWGAFWVWDARLTSTALMAVLFIGYLALRKVPGSPDQVAKRAAVAAVVSFVDVPIDYYSVQWWNTLHQTSTLEIGAIHGSMAWALLLGFLSFTLLFAWMVGVRYRIEATRALDAERALRDAVAARQREGGVMVEVGV